MRAVGHIPIDRAARKKAFEAYDEAARMIREGTSSSPCSRRGRAAGPASCCHSRTRRLVSAIAAQVPIVPVYVHHTFEILPKGAWRLRPRPDSPARRAADHDDRIASGRSRAAAGPSARGDGLLFSRRQVGSSTMSTVISVHAREILDSRGNPTVETDVTLASGASAGRPFRAVPRRRVTEARSTLPTGITYRRQATSLVTPVEAPLGTAACRSRRWPG